MADNTPSAHAVVAWEQLSALAQTAAIAVAADVIGHVSPAVLPKLLVPVARFTAGKRAKRGASPLARALSQDASFRALVATYLPPDFGVGDTMAQAAARAFFLQLPDAHEVISRDAQAAEAAILREQVSQLQATVELLTARLAVATATGAGKSAPAQGSAVQQQATKSGPDDQVAQLQQRLRSQGQRMRQAADTAAAQIAALEDELLAALQQKEEADAAVTQWRVQAERHRSDVRSLRQKTAARQRRDEQHTADNDRRIALLLDSASQAVAAVRHQWELRTGGADPADVVARAYQTAEPSRGQQTSDGSLLLAWLQLPGAHLIVDGYNVTKLLYDHLSLSQQRDRLVRSLGSVAVRTGADVTVVFDGAGVVAPAASTPRVRVMFSPAGVIADDIIRDVARAEPHGRVVIVVTSDREIINDVTVVGARTAGSAVLQELLP